MSTGTTHDRNMNKRKCSEDAKDCETSVSKTVKMETNIIEMNDDCLGAVFNLLSVRDLLNTALAIRKNDRINIVLNDVFEKKFGRSVVFLSNYFVHEKLHIQVLERFGHLISKLNLSFRLPEFRNFCDAIINN